MQITKCAIIKKHSGGAYMINIHQLEQLIYINDCGTISKAAKQLHISQPALSRSMQRLEEELEVPLFSRTKNKIELNDNGLLAIQLARTIVQSTKDMKTTLKDYDQSKHTFSIGSCAPAPNLYLIEKIHQFYPDKIVLSEMKSYSALIDGLKNKNYHVIIMPYPIEDEDIECIEFMEEQLYFSLPFDHPFAKRQSLSFKEMDGERMLLMSQIGFWHDMHKKTMPHTKFLIQEDRSIFYDLVELSSLPSFTSDYVMEHEGKRENRVIVPICDKEAHATFYCWYLLENEKSLKNLLYHL